MYFKHKNIHKQAWIFPDRQICNQINHVLIDKRRHTDVLDIRSYRGADCNSDHCLVMAKIRERRALVKNSRKIRPKKFNSQRLRKKKQEQIVWFDK